MGIDASQLELRLLAHYMADKEYVNEVLHGDIHTTNQKLAGLESRDQAKTFIYALIWSRGKLKRLEKSLEEIDKKVKECESLFSIVSHHLTILRTELSQQQGKDFLKGLDGRKIRLRHQHLWQIHYYNVVEQ